MGIDIGPQLNILQLNCEKISKVKSELIARIAFDNDVGAILLQETATIDEADIDSRGEIPGFRLVAAIHSPNSRTAMYGIATYVRNDGMIFLILRFLLKA